MGKSTGFDALLQIGVQIEEGNPHHVSSARVLSIPISSETIPQVGVITIHLEQIKRKLSANTVGVGGKIVDRC